MKMEGERYQKVRPAKCRTDPSMYHSPPTLSLEKKKQTKCENIEKMIHFGGVISPGDAL